MLRMGRGVGVSQAHLRDVPQVSPSLSLFEGLTATGRGLRQVCLTQLLHTAPRSSKNGYAQKSASTRLSGLRVSLGSHRFSVRRRCLQIPERNTEVSLQGLLCGSQLCLFVLTENGVTLDLVLFSGCTISSLYYFFVFFSCMISLVEVIPTIRKLDTRNWR